MEDESNKETVCIVVKDVTFNCFKRNLILSSDYFKAMFSSHFIENKENTVELKDVDPDAMKRILNHINEGSLSIISDVNICLAVLQCASMLQFSKVQKLCEDFLIEEVSSKNCWQIYSTSRRLSNWRVSEAALTLSLWWFSDVVKSSYFLNLSLQEVIDYLSTPGLNLGLMGEWNVWEAILKWIQFNESERRELILPLLKCLDYSSLAVFDISNLMFYDIITDSEKATTFLESIKTCLQPPEMDKKDVDRKEVCIKGEIAEQAWTSVHGDERIGRCVPSVPCLVCYKKRQTRAGGSFPVVYCYDDATRGIEQLVEVSKLDESQDVCVGFRVCSVGPYLYITGGQYIIGGNTWNNDVWSYNVITHSWQVHLSLPHPRRNHMVCVLGSVIYLLGGYGKHRISLNTMDAYDVATGKWLNCPFLPFTGVGAFCAFKDRLLVFVNCFFFGFYPDRRAWLSFAVKVDQQRSYAAAVAYRDAVYLLGAHSREVFRIQPDVRDGMEIKYFGSFVNETVNMCLDESRLISFSVCEDAAKREVNVVEMLSLDSEEEEEEEERGKGKERRGRKAKVVWMEQLKDSNSTSQTSHAHNESSYGCFSLFKLRRDRMVEMFG